MHPMNPKTSRSFLALAGAVLLGFGLTVFAADKKSKLAVKPYPLDVCAVADEKLGSMGDAHVFHEGDQEIKLCCKSCLKSFNKDKKEILAKIETAWKEVKRYPLDTCIVSGEALPDGKTVGLVHEKREFHFCCKGCAKDFPKDAAAYVKKFDEAAKKKS